MRIENRPIEMPVTGQTGAATRIEDLTDCAVTLDFTGAGASSVIVQGKMSTPQKDGPWVALSAAINATTVFSLSRVGTAELGAFSVPWTHLRIVSTTTGAPAPSAFVTGRNHRAS